MKWHNWPLLLSAGTLIASFSWRCHPLIQTTQMPSKDCGAPLLDVRVPSYLPPACLAISNLLFLVSNVHLPPREARESRHGMLLPSSCACLCLLPSPLVSATAILVPIPTRRTPGAPPCSCLEHPCLLIASSRCAASPPALSSHPFPEQHLVSRRRARHPRPLRAG